MGIQAGVDRRDHPHRRQRIPTQIEKRVLDPDPLQPQHLGINTGQNLLGGSGRGAITINILVFRCRQGAFVQLAVDRQRQRVDHHHRRRHHIRREPLGQRASHPGRVRGPGHITHQALITGAVLAGDHHRLLHPIQPGQRRATSPSSMRYPRILTCSSARPKYCSCPSAPHRTKSPVRYIRAPDPRTDTPQTATRSTRPGAHTRTPPRDRPHTTHRPHPPTPGATPHPAQTTPPRHRRPDRRPPPTPPSTTHSSRHTPWSRSVPYILIITAPRGAHHSASSLGPAPHRPPPHACRLQLIASAREQPSRCTHKTPTGSDSRR